MRGWETVEGWTCSDHATKGNGTINQPNEEDVTAAMRSNLFVEVTDDKCPIVFHPDYDVVFFGLERTHVFDPAKWGNVFSFLQEWNLVDEDSVIVPREASRSDLMICHTRQYLQSLNSPCVLASVFEVPWLSVLPSCLSNKYLLRRMRLQTGGTVAAARLALDTNWAINIGGGFHHCCVDRGGGFCVYADISLAVKMLLLLHLVERVLILDVDAHQGNGHERDFVDDPRVFIVDLFNPDIYPKDSQAMVAISRAVPIHKSVNDEKYLRILHQNMEAALGEFAADVIVYNAGTDSLEGDPLGGLSLSSEGIVKRDETVFHLAREHAVPIVMLTSGGYQKNNAKVIAESIRNLHEKGLIHLKKSHNDK